MSIYHNDMHLGDDPSKCRFLVDKNGDCWEIMLIFPNFDTELVGDYVFIASNEGGFDKSKITLKLEEEIASNLGDPLPHIEMWIEKQSGNCKIIEPWRKFKLERLQQNKLGVTLLQKSLKLVQVGDTIVLQAINVFGEIITKH
uniref:Galectin n=1 Tax=Meloidogyne javanica TaxID=6303 RepID=A0A915MXD1_MELJA